MTLPEDDFRLFELLRQLATRWRTLAACTLGTAVLFVGVASSRPSIYVAATSFVPEISAQRRLSGAAAGLAGLAGQFGLALGGDVAQSPRFYAGVIRSRAVRERLLLARFPDPRPGAAPGDSVTLLALLRVGGRTRADTLERGARRVGNLLQIHIDNQTRIVRVTARSRYPTLAADVANRVVAELNVFNAGTRQSQARERRAFVESRILEVRQSLRDAEDRLRRFYETNRSWQQSPEMTVEESRLRQQVELARELYVTLSREFETARIEEVNDTPVLTVIDPAVAPVRRSFPRRRVALAVGLMFGFLGGALWVLGSDYWKRATRVPR